MMNQSFLQISLTLCSGMLKRYGKASSGSVSIEYALLAASMLGGVTVGAVQIKDDMSKGYGDIADVIEGYSKTVDVSNLSTEASGSGSGSNNNNNSKSRWLNDQVAILVKRTDKLVERTTAVDSLIKSGYSKNSGAYNNTTGQAGYFVIGSSDPTSILESNSSDTAAIYSYTDDGTAGYTLSSNILDDGDGRNNDNAFVLDDNDIHLDGVAGARDASTSNIVVSITPEKDVPYVITFDLNQRVNRDYAIGDDSVASDQGDSFIDLYYDGELIDTIRPPKNQWETYSYAILGEGERAEIQFVERNVNSNQESTALLDNVYIENGELVNGGPEMTFIGTRAADEVTVTFGDLQGAVIDKEATESV